MAKVIEYLQTDSGACTWWMTIFFILGNSRICFVLRSWNDSYVKFLKKIGQKIEL